MSKLRIIVGGLVGQYPMGGVAWDYFHYVLGLAELGHDVYYHEDTWVWPHDPTKGFAVDDPSYTVNFIGDFAAAHPVFKHHNTYFSYADTIMPAFHFAVGFALRLTLLKRL